MAPSKSWPAAALAAFLLFFPGQASAFCRTMSCELGETADAPCQRDAANICVVEGQPTHWPDSCLAYAVQVDGSPRSGLDADQVHSLVTAAFNVWRSAACSGGGTPGFAPVFQGFVGCDRHQAVCGAASENVNVFLFHDDAWPADLASNALAVTTPIGSIQSGLLIDADIEFNSANYVFDTSDPNAIDLSRVIAHELGHFLGLSHSDQPGALMSVSYQELPAGDEIVLTPDDVAAICEVYPPRAEPVSCRPSTPKSDACAAEDLSNSSVPCSLPVGSPAHAGCSLSAGPVSSSSAPWGLLLALGSVLGLRRARPGASAERRGL